MQRLCSTKAMSPTAIRQDSELGEFHYGASRSGTRQSSDAGLTKRGTVMKITFKCVCGKTMKVAAEHAGRKIPCLGCGASITVPGTRVTVSQADQTSKEMWKLKELRAIAAEEDDADYRFSCMAISPSGQIAATGSRFPGHNGRALRFWNLPEAVEMEDFGADNDSIAEEIRHVQALAFSVDGRRLACAASSTGGKRIHVFHLGERSPPTPSRPSRNGPPPARFMPSAFRDGRFVACGGVDGVWVWGMKSGKEYHRFEKPMRSLAFSPDGKYLLGGELGDLDAEFCDLILWNLQTGKIIERFGATPTGSTPSPSPPMARTSSRPAAAIRSCERMNTRCGSGKSRPATWPATSTATSAGSRPSPSRRTANTSSPPAWNFARSSTPLPPS